MSEATIYTFSGTGNSLAVARDIAAEIDGRLVPIPAVMTRETGQAESRPAESGASMEPEETVRPETEVVGLVFPVYFEPHGGLPQIIKRFAAKLAGLESRYIFALCTYGSASVAALDSLADLIRSRGGRLSAGFTVNMPENIYPAFARRRHARMFETWRSRVDDVCARIRRREAVELHLPNLLVGRAYGLVRRVARPVLPLLRGVAIGQLQRIAESPLEDYDELIPLVDHGFRVDERCNRCGVCVDVCPVNNIRMTDAGPSWMHRCEFCLACLHWCPRHAIGSRAVMSPLSYHHPEVRLSDMLRTD